MCASARDGEDETAGLCASCVHVRRVTSDRGSVFYRCGYAAVDVTFPKYPRLPVWHCRAHTPDPAAKAPRQP
jgi:hypothetical protein